MNGYGTGINPHDLDMHITGHYGEDQFDKKCWDCCNDNCTQAPSDCDGPYETPADYKQEDEDELD